MIILDQHQIYLLIMGGQITEHFYKTQGAQIWNNLPDDLKVLKTLFT